MTTPLSTYLGTTAQAATSAFAINSGDLVEMMNNQIYSAKVIDYAVVPTAGAQIVPNTQVALTGVPPSATQRADAMISTVDGSIFCSYATVATTGNMAVAKYSAGGTLLGTVTLDTANAMPFNPRLLQLSNNNIAALWQLTGGVLAFAIIDQNLQVITAKTNVDTPNANQFGACALSGGGFAVAYGKAAGVQLAVYTNTGGVTSAAATIAGTPIAGASVRMGQLSSGNIAIAISATTAAKALGHAVFSVLGVAVAAYAVLDAATCGTANYPELSIMTGFYACAFGDATNRVAYVLNNAGALQGAGFTTADTTVTAASSNLMNDGTAFWLVYNGSVTAQGLVYIPTTGTNYVSSALAGASFAAPFAAFLDKNNLVMLYSTVIAAWTLNASSGNATRAQTYTGPTATAVGTAMAGGDFAVVAQTANTSAFLSVYKYANAPIVGVSQQSVAAGNAGTAINVSTGPGTYPINTLFGTGGKTFGGPYGQGQVLPSTVVFRAAKNIN